MLKNRKSSVISTHLELPDGADKDAASKRVVVWMNRTGMLEISAEGYGEHDAGDGYGSPVVLEWRNQKLVLHVWADINCEDTTTISLEGARESLRKLARSELLQQLRTFCHDVRDGVSTGCELYAEALGLSQKIDETLKKESNENDRDRA